MTPLTIIPNYDKKRLKCYGTVAAGEHVLVTVTGGNDWVAPDGENQTLRLRLLFGPHTVAVFPFVTEDMHEKDPETFPTVDEWDVSGDDPTCDLNLNTIQAAKFLKFGGNCLFVLDDPTNDILYATGEFEVLPWPKRRGEDLPYDLDGYPDFVFDAKNAMAEAAANAQNAADSAATAVDTVNAALETADNFVNRAETAATNAQASANGASNSKKDAEAWAVGERGGEAVGTDDETYHNNAKYYAGQAGDAKTDAAASATSAAAAASAAANSATAASGSATSAASSAQSAAGAAEAAVETEKERAEGAESDLADAIDAEKERAEGAEALAIVNAAYNENNHRIVFTTGGGDSITIDASAFIKDGMVSSVAVSNGNLVITFNSDAGKQPISLPLTSIFNPSNYYDKTAADGTFVKKDGAKVLSTNDFTNALKTKLDGIAEGANNYSLPPASASTLGGVKQGAGCEIASDGTLNVTGGGGGETPIAPSTDPSAAGKPADAKATGDELAEKRGVNNFLVNGWVLKEPGGDTVALGYISEDNLWVGGGYDLSFNNGTWVLSDAQDSWDVSAPENATSLTFTDGTSVYSLVRASRLALDVDVSGKQDALSAAQLANIAAVPGKADAADLRYRIAEAGFKYQFAASAFPITYMNTITSTAVTITAGDAGDITWDVQPDGGAYVSYNGFDFAYFSSTGDYGGSQQGVDLQFNGVAAAYAGEPLVQILADRAVNLITADDGTASIDIELPEAVTVDDVRYARDFILDVDNRTNSDAINLEFTGLGTDYGFVVDADENLAEMMTVAGETAQDEGDGERVRLYFTECALSASSPTLPLFHVARVTLSIAYGSIPSTQGGN